MGDSKEKENKTTKKEVNKEKGTQKGFPWVIVIVLGIIVFAAVAFRIFNSKIKNKASNFLVSKIVSEQVGGDVEISNDGENISYKGEDFEFSVGSGDELPENFPKDFPIYENAKLISKWSSEDQEGSGLSLMWETDDTLDKVSDFYESQFEKNGWNITSTFKQEDSTVFSAEKDSQEALLGIAVVEEKLNISVVFGSNKE